MVDWARLVVRGRALEAVAWGVVVVALLVHAHSYDFFADDAFIALRYSESLIERGELSYNPGERVEGFTSPLWVLLVAALGFAGAPLHGSLVHWAQALGAACSVGTLWAVTRLWRELVPNASRWPALAVGALLAASAPFAAWSLGGLEMPLFALLLTLGIARLGHARALAGARSWALAGVVCALAALARPEGLGLVLAGAIAALWPAAASQDRWNKRLLAFGLPVLLLVGGYLAFRLRYYGDPLPNTYYVKLTGVAGLARRGVKYVASMAREFGVAACLAACVALLWPLALAPWRFRRWLALPAPSLTHLVSGLTLTLYLIYLTRIGGDFLDLYRFAAPLLPILLALAVATAVACVQHMRARVRTRWQPALLALATLGLAALSWDYGRHQLWMAARVNQPAWYQRPEGAPPKPKGVESLAWTRIAALQWAALGRVLAEISVPGDTSAIGAAGAAPFYARQPNLDLHGLNDAWVARHGNVGSKRPGHQRFASRSYIRKRKPTFLFLAGWPFSTQPTQLSADRYWSRQGYVAGELRVDPERHGALRTYYQPLLLRRDRAAALSQNPYLRIAETP